MECAEGKQLEIESLKSSLLLYQNEHQTKCKKKTVCPLFHCGNFYSTYVGAGRASVSCHEKCLLKQYEGVHSAFRKHQWTLSL
jgi:hypothetical protein